MFTPFVYGNERQAMHYSLLIQGLPTNYSFEWINPYKYRNPYITSMTVLFTPNQVMFNNVDSANVATNSNDEELTIPPGYYAIGLIIAILNNMTDTTFSISTKASSYGCIYIQSPHTLSITPILRIFEKSLVWKDKWSFYPLRSMDRT